MDDVKVQVSSTRPTSPGVDPEIGFRGQLQCRFRSAEDIEPRRRRRRERDAKGIPFHSGIWSLGETPPDGFFGIQIIRNSISVEASPRPRWGAYDAKLPQRGLGGVSTEIEFRIIWMPKKPSGGTYFTELFLQQFHSGCTICYEFGGMALCPSLDPPLDISKDIV